MSDYPNSGILNRNRWKKAGTKMPDASGQCHVTCPNCKQETEFVIAGWIREGKSKFTALKFEEKSKADARRLAAKAAKSGLPVEGVDASQSAGIDRTPSANSETATQKTESDYAF